jgi:ubiquinone/menaquinone biosynthesis C-methylase UbiE
MSKCPPYSPEPTNNERFTKQFDTFYSRFARVYDWLVKSLPLWQRWIMPAIPYLRGPRVLEVSFGTDYLLTRYARHFETYAIDINRRMAHVAQDNLARSGLAASLLVGDVGALPFVSESFDSVVNTMAFTGYPDARRAMAELRRVLKPGGRLVMVDINYPANANWLGRMVATAWATTGDILRDMHQLLHEYGFAFTDQEIGGFGSVVYRDDTKSCAEPRCIGAWCRDSTLW